MALSFRRTGRFPRCYLFRVIDLRARSFATLALLVALSTPLHATTSALPFIADDYPKALAEARAKKLPIFLEAWAPWCHSCRSMQAYVYTDPKLAPYADRFVWLAIDTEKAGNAATVAKFPVSAWPSMFVIDPATETVAYRWTGSATVDQLTAFLDEARSRPAAKRAPGAPADPAALALARADKLYGAGEWDAAATAYAAVLAHSAAADASFARAADAYLFSLLAAERGAECVRAARELLPKLAGRPSSATAAAVGLDCAVRLDAAAPERAAAITELEAATRGALADRSLKLATDDLSGLYISLISARDDAKDTAEKAKLLEAWIALLEDGAAKAVDANARAVFDSHRLAAYLEAGQPERAVRMLEAAERDLPADYNPPARLAVAYLAMKKHNLALAASDRALAKSYGPRRLGQLRTRADILLAMGRPADAKAVLEQAIAEYQALPQAQRSERTLAGLKQKLETLNPAKAS
jgi:thiol-disulfide isomerase/thioredoxin